MKILLFAPAQIQLYYHRLELAAALRVAGHEVVLASPRGPHGTALAQGGWCWYEVPLQRGFRQPWEDWRGMRRLAEIVRRERPDVLHVFTTKGVALGAWARLLSGRQPGLVNSVTGLGPVWVRSDLRTRLTRLAVEFLYRFSLSRPASIALFENSDDLRFLEGRGLLRGRPAHVLAGAGVSIEKFRPSHRADSGPMRVLLAGRYLVTKGLREYAQAADILRRQGLCVQFWIAGGPDAESYDSIPQAELLNWTAQGLIQDHGQCDMPTLLGEVDVAVLPSYREGLSRYLMEAAAAGKPLIATDVPGCRELVQEGENGLLVPPRDPSALARAIARLQADGELRRQMGERSRQMALEKLDGRVVHAEVLALYQRYFAAGKETAPISSAVSA